MSLGDFLSKVWAPVVAKIALFWNIALVIIQKRAKGAIETYVASRAEISYAQNGLVILLQLSLLAKHRDVFVRHAGLRLLNIRTSERHELGWLAFHEYVRDAANPSQFPKLVVKEFASPVLASLSSPVKQVISFTDEELFENLSGPVQEWIAAVNEVSRTNNYCINEDVVQAVGALPITVRTYTAVRDAMYLRAGDYLLTVVVEDATGNAFAESYNFSVTPEQQEILQNNAAPAISLVPDGQTPPIPMSVFVELRPVSK